MNSSIISSIRRLAQDDNGAAVTEYAVALGLVVVAVTVVLTLFGSKVLARWETIVGKLDPEATVVKTAHPDAVIMTADQLIDLLKLQKHPNEGGYFRETYRTPATYQPAGYPGARSVSTAIYYLITPDSFSALHRLPGDEIFHHYHGEAVEMLMLHPSGAHEVVRIGHNIDRGERPQVVVPGGVWQGSRLVGWAGFALLGCTMAPGFDYADYEHGQRDELVAQFPAAAEHIISLTT